MKLAGPMRKRFTLDMDSLDGIFRFIGEFVHTSNIDEGVYFQIKLAVEELVTNMIKYNQKQGGETEIYLGIEENNLVISLTDFDVPFFDITKVKEYDTGQVIEERPIGKVGIHLIRKMMDTFEYHYQDNNSIIILKKHIKK